MGTLNTHVKAASGSVITGNASKGQARNDDKIGLAWIGSVRLDIKDGAAMLIFSAAT
jgi:hypothetical protein